MAVVPAVLRPLLLFVALPVFELESPAAAVEEVDEAAAVFELEALAAAVVAAALI